MWTNRGCSACVGAKRYFEQKGIHVQERRLKSDAATREAFSKATKGAKSVPQIIIQGRLIGGFDDVKRLEKIGELDVLLGLKTEVELSRMKRFLLWLGF